MIVERVIGHPLPARANVHHIDGNRNHNVNTNLVACENTGYHNLLHRRQRALESCGHADWMICRRCKKYGSPDVLKVYVSNGATKAYHKTSALCESALPRITKVK